MSRADPSLLRLSVVCGGRPHDLAVPAGVPVAALVVALLEEVDESLDPGAGHDLRTAAGRCLDAETGLREQGVRDGAVLVLAARGVDRPPHPHDDLVDAVREAVVRDRRPLSGPVRRGAVLAAATTLALLTVAALVALEGNAVGATAGASSLVVAVALLLGARVASGAGRPSADRPSADRPGGRAPVVGDPAVALTCAVAASGLAAAGGLLVAPAAPALLAGGAALVAASSAGLALLARLPGARAVLVPPVVTGTVLAATGAASLLAPGAAARVLPGAVVLAVAVAGTAPTWALPAVGRGAEPLLLTGDTGPTDPFTDPRATPGTAPGTVDHQVREAHELVLASIAVVGVLLVVTAPVAVTDGVSAGVLVAAAAVVTALRARRHHGRALVLTGLAGAAGGLVSTTAAVIVLVPTARPVVAAVLLVATTVLACAAPAVRPCGQPGGTARATATGVPASVSASAVRARRLAGAAETGALVSLLPLLVVASGLLDVARGV